MAKVKCNFADVTDSLKSYEVGDDYKGPREKELIDKGILEAPKKKAPKKENKDGNPQAVAKKTGKKPPEKKAPVKKKAAPKKKAATKK